MKVCCEVKFRLKSGSQKLSWFFESKKFSEYISEQLYLQNTMENRGAPQILLHKNEVFHKGFLQ